MEIFNGLTAREIFLTSSGVGGLIVIALKYLPGFFSWLYSSFTGYKKTVTDREFRQAENDTERIKLLWSRMDKMQEDHDEEIAALRAELATTRAELAASRTENIRITDENVKIKRENTNIKAELENIRQQTGIHA